MVEVHLWPWIKAIVLSISSISPWRQLLPSMAEMEAMSETVSEDHQSSRGGTYCQHRRRGPAGVAPVGTREWESSRGETWWEGVRSVGIKVGGSEVFAQRLGHQKKSKKEVSTETDPGSVSASSILASEDRHDVRSTTHVSSVLGKYLIFVVRDCTNHSLAMASFSVVHSGPLSKCRRSHGLVSAGYNGRWIEYIARLIC